MAHRLLKHAFGRALLALAGALVLAAAPARGESFSRSGWREYSLQPFLIGSRSYDCANGASARLDGGAGVSFGMAQHLNDYFAVGFDFALATADFRARVVPDAGNAGAAFDSGGQLDRATLLFHATWNLLASRTTPLLTAGFGATYLEPDFDANPPTAGCWVYPWWDRFCGAEPPSHGITRFTYTLGAGLRHDFARELGFVRALVIGEFIDWSGPPDRLESVQLRADFGLRF